MGHELIQFARIHTSSLIKGALMQSRYENLTVSLFLHKSNMPKVLHYNTFRDIHTRVYEMFVTNMQKQ